MNAFLRNMATGLFRFVLVTLLVALLLIGTALVVAIVGAWMRDEDAFSPQFLSIGAVGALITWLFVAIFHLRHETQVIPYSQRKQFILKAKTVLQEMGYSLVSQHGNTLVYWPCFRSYLFGGGILIDAGEQEATITGPKFALDLFRRRFRLKNHVQRVHQYLDSHRRFTENVLKRVELHLRIEPEQFETVRSNVIKRLQKEGVVICELNILVQSDKGIQENLIEGQIRDWLEQNQIDCDIHKDVIQFVEVIESELESDKVGL